MTTSALSPASSPRLPSPPPIAEDQLGPKSPITATDEQQRLFMEDNGAARRIHPGTKAVDMAEGPPLVELEELQSMFPLTEHLKALHNFLTHPIGSNSTIAIDKDVALKLAHPPENADKTLWLYELCRFLTQKVNAIIVALFADNPPCSSITCPEMRASEWQYLCAVHDPPKSCCAIDYCCHTLDWAANQLTMTKTFPYRTQMGADGSAQQHSQIRLMTNIFRRVYRIFAHAWFQHREVFWKVEGRTGLYIFFKTVCDVYGLIPEDNYTIPPEAEGEEPATEAPAAAAAPLILKREPSGPGPQENENASVIEGISDHTLSTAGTTKRHRHSPSVGATSVTTVVEENEEEEEHQPKEEVPHVEPPQEDDATAKESTPLEEATIGETGEDAGEHAQSAESGEVDAGEAAAGADEAEKQSTGAAEKEYVEPHQEEKESEAHDDQTATAETEGGSNEETDEVDVKLEAEEPPSSEPEKEKVEVEVEEPAANPDSAGDVKEPGEKAGSEE